MEEKRTFYHPRRRRHRGRGAEDREGCKGGGQMVKWEKKKGNKMKCSEEKGQRDEK